MTFKEWSSKYATAEDTNDNPSKPEPKETPETEQEKPKVDEPKGHPCAGGSYET